jgi:DeoR/GlpR family transcriptional regulator of sugar metabolism
MFGSKQGKQDRLETILEILREHDELTVTQLADLLGVPRKTIYTDLTALNDKLQENDGLISIYHPY